MPLEIPGLTPAQIKSLEKAADTCARCKPFLQKLRELEADPIEEEERIRHLNRTLLNALGYDIEDNRGQS